MKAWLSIAGACAMLWLAVFVPYFSREDNLSNEIATGVSEPRSPDWPAVRAAHLKRQPECAACGYKGPENQVHHVSPFHLGAVNEHGETLELDPENLVTLCGPGHRSHHIDIGHGGNYRCRNPHVREDAERFRKMRECKVCD